MILFVACVRDAKTDVYSQPMFFVTRGVAVRAFFDECKRDNSDVAKHPEDFAFFHVGHFDDQKGVFVNLDQPVQIAHALDNFPTQGG